MCLQNASSRLQHGVITPITTICAFIISYKNYNAVTYWKNEERKVTRTTDSIDTRCKIRTGEANIHGSCSEFIERKKVVVRNWI
jgi:hypothetical protein